MRKSLAFSLLLISSAASAGTWLESGSSWRAIDFACETPGYIISMEGSGNPGNPSETLTYHGTSKADPATSLTLTSPFSVVGADGCGAGHCYYDFPNGTYTYSINWVTPGLYDESILAGSVRVQRSGTLLMEQTCRVVQKAVAQCITNNRTVYVIDDGNGTYSYQDFDFANSSMATPNLTLKNGTLTSSSTENVYAFQNGAYRYSLTFAPSTATEGFGRLTVGENGRKVLSQNCTSYTSP